tara:strand:- start:1584 stop:3155 length:1572 start_codon:yes stop_codon:yes gene_type:complete
MGITVFPTPTSSTSSGGSGLSTDFTKNDYGVPLPEYITCMAYKSSCTITVCPGYTFCSGSKGFSQGGLTNVKDNIFVATGVEHPYGNSDCTKVFAMAFCVNDDTGAIVSGMTEFKCIFQSASTNDRLGGEGDTNAVGDGDSRVYYGGFCSSLGRVHIICTNDSFNCIGTGGSPVSYAQSNAGAGVRLVYNGVPGQVMAHVGNNEDKNAFIRFGNGNTCFNNNLPNSIDCTNCFAPGNLRGKYALSPNTIVLSGMCLQNDSMCLKTILFQWNEASDCYRMAYCKFDGLGSRGSSSCINDCLGCALSVGHILGQSFRVGPTFYPEGGFASFWHQKNEMDCISKVVHTNNMCRETFRNSGALLTWQGQGHWNLNARGYRGCSISDTDDFFASNIDYNVNWSSNNGCINNFPRTTSIQQNGVYGAGIAAKGCFAFNCNNTGLSKQETFSSWSHNHDINSVFNPMRSALTAYPIPQLCNCYRNCCFNFLASQVIGCKWIVVMESSQCAACECVTLHAYKIMTNSCTAD